MLTLHILSTPSFYASVTAVDLLVDIQRKEMFFRLAFSSSLCNNLLSWRNLGFYPENEQSSSVH